MITSAHEPVALVPRDNHPALHCAQNHSDLQIIPSSQRIPLNEQQLNKQPSAQTNSTVTPPSGCPKDTKRITNHKQAEQSSLQCSICGKVYGHRSSLYKHIYKQNTSKQSRWSHWVPRKELHLKCNYINDLREHLAKVLYWNWRAIISVGRR